MASQYQDRCASRDVADTELVPVCCLCHVHVRSILLG